MAWIVALADEAEVSRIERAGYEVEHIERDTYGAFFECTPRELDAINPNEYVRVWVDCAAEDLLSMGE